METLTISDHELDAQIEQAIKAGAARANGAKGGRP